MPIKRSILIAAASLFAIGAAPNATEVSKPVVKDSTFLFTIRIARNELYDTKKWTPEDQKLGQEHFNYLADLARAGVVEIGGLTGDVDGKGFLDPDTIGIAIVHAPDRQSAERLAAMDPGVRGGLVRTKVQSFDLSIRGSAN